MINIEGFQINFDFSKFRCIADLIYFDGPFLSHYVSDKGDDYLFYWVDGDETDNRWLVIRVNLPDLQRYIAHEIPLRDIVVNPNDGYVYMIDVDDNLNYHNIKLLQPQNLPEDYLPSMDSFYEFEPMPAKDAPALLTYQFTIPYEQHNKFEMMLSKIGIPMEQLKMKASQAMVF